MSISKRLAALAVAAGILAGLAPVVGSPVQAAQCDATVIVFTQTGTFLPGGLTDPRNGRNSIANPTYDSAAIGCQTSPDAEFNTALVYPGANLIQSRLTSGEASGYCFDGIVGHCGPAALYAGTLANYYESERIALDPTGIGCLRAWFNTSAPVEYCTVTHASP
ncbi:MAG TPA: hypothetical protein VNE62_06575 [Actinomycetota bacterium]|nr:hypothetical protein [Actinomycetota bacterium]